MTIAFTKVKAQHGWLSNMAPYPLEYRGKRWPTAEHLFQALRFASDSDREAIRAEKSPMAAKFVAKKLVPSFTITDDLDRSEMFLVIGLKLQQHPEVRTLLASTGDEKIIEDVTARATKGRAMFWGAEWQRDKEVWVGENTLGKIWMTYRDLLQPGNKPYKQSWCPLDTDDDGTCGRKLCPWCGEY